MNATIVNVKGDADLPPGGPGLAPRAGGGGVFGVALKGWKWVAVLAVVVAALVLLATRLAGRSPSPTEPPAADAGDKSQSPPGTAPEAVGPAPRIVAEQLEHDFGFVQPWEDCVHTFVIRNQGDAPSTLSVVSTSCVCTVGKLAHDLLQSGEQTEITVTVKPQIKEEAFEQGTKIKTSDPQHEYLIFMVRGVVRRLVEASPAQLEFINLGPGVQQTASTVVYSPSWDAFRVEDVHCSLPGATWKVESAAPAVLGRLKARCGYRLSVTTPPDLPAGTLAERLLLELQPEPAIYQPRELVVDLRGYVSGPVSFDGPRLDAQGVLQLGTLSHGQGTRTRVLMKVRDPQRALQVTRVQTTPEYLQVQVTPYAADAPQLGLYRIEIELPPDAPPAAFSGPHPGEIRIETDHPRLANMRLQVEFAVAANVAGVVP